MLAVKVLISLTVLVEHPAFGIYACGRHRDGKVKFGTHSGLRDIDHICLRQPRPAARMPRRRYGRREKEMVCIDKSNRGLMR